MLLPKQKHMVKAMYLNKRSRLIVYSHLSNFSAIRRLSPLPVKGLKI
jgi:hypothetical protein